MKSEFQEEFSALLNKHSKENGSNTPDFILVEFLSKVLRSFDYAVNHRSAWFKNESQEEASEVVRRGLIAVEDQSYKE